LLLKEDRVCVLVCIKKTVVCRVVSCLYAFILNGWYFYFKIVASEYLLLEIMWIRRYWRNCRI